MRIAVPLLDGRMADHFGHAPRFALFTVEPEEKRIGDEKILDAPPHEPGVLPEWLHQQGASVVLARGIGSRAHQLFAQHGIEVVIGVEAEDAREAAAAYLAGASGRDRIAAITEQICQRIVAFRLETRSERPAHHLLLSCAS